MAIALVPSTARVSYLQKRSEHLTAKRAQLKESPFSSLLGSTAKIYQKEDVEQELLFFEHRKSLLMKQKTPPFLVSQLNHTKLTLSPNPGDILDPIS